MDYDAGRECCEDHPRMRGEHAMSRCCFPVFEGSSPHARGALDTVQRHGGWKGIIPACAGSTRIVTVS